MGKEAIGRAIGGRRGGVPNSLEGGGEGNG
jgi:hypothetical protein